jgi:hypothetical protein
MPSVTRAIRAVALMLVWASTVGAPSARAQMAMAGGSRSLGGYGASTISSYYSAGGTSYLPYAGNSRGFIPYSGGAGGGMGAMASPRWIPATPIGGAMAPGQTAIGGASVPGGMGTATRGGMGMGTGSGPRTYTLYGSMGGAGMGGDMSATGRPGGRRRSPTGPGLGNPFRMPPSLPGSGGSMSVP